MGLVLVQCLARSFAERVIASDVDRDRLRMAGEYGAHVLLNPTEDGFGEQLAAAQAMVIDTVVDASGSQAGLTLSTQLVKRGGRINIFGWMHGPVSFLGDDWHANGYTIVNSSPAAKIRDPFPVAARLIASGMVRMERLVTHVVSLDELPTLMADAAGHKLPGYIKGVVKLSET